MRRLAASLLAIGILYLSGATSYAIPPNSNATTKSMKL